MVQKIWKPFSSEAQILFNKSCRIYINQTIFYYIEFEENDFQIFETINFYIKVKKTAFILKETHIRGIFYFPNS